MSPSTDTIRSQILDAAEIRFRGFGFGKTTMAEIAEDAGMSAANLYRYFESKLDLGAACCARAMQLRVDLLRAVARDTSKSASERLQAFFLANIEISHKLVGEQPRMNEMVQNMTEKRPDLVRDKVQAIESLVAEILAFGNESREFDIDDVLDTARSVHASMVLFEVPIFVGLYPKEQYLQRAARLAQLLVKGLRRG